jgi:hypothetical protein
VVYTTVKLMNKAEIEELLLEIVKTAHDQLRGQAMLLNVKEEIDLFVATEGHETFGEVIQKNFMLDEADEVIDEEQYRLLLNDLSVAFEEMYKTAGLFDYFPAGEYVVNGE